MAQGYTRVRPTEAEVAKYMRGHPGARGPAVNFGTCNACGARLWLSGLGIGSHERGEKHNTSTGRTIVNQTERGPIDRTTAKSIQEIDGGPIQATGKALVTDRRWPQAAGTDQEFTGPQDVRDSIDAFTSPHLVPFKPTQAVVGWPSTSDPWSLPAPSMMLRNGAIVVLAKRTDTDEGVVLALTHGMAGDPFVVWRLDLKTGYTYSGDYADTLDLAIRYLDQRAGF